MAAADLARDVLHVRHGGVDRLLMRPHKRAGQILVAGWSQSLRRVDVGASRHKQPSSRSDHADHRRTHERAPTIAVVPM